ncbi:uncharacterized protein LAJ45_05117 [Morchella importuna]|uniref:uncharacterized protein n=1 Tax=Morchella importuna TaxID=1174673 RepID=UPI001E8D21C4|nr:uncharacterized protein LAJ45_05117 [Morchella importuna]KAH8150935.1 hypothetical protein LAJ45_05117 [Morchella importuna]
MVHYVHIFLLALLILQIWLIGQTRGQNGYIREPIAAASPSHHHSHSRLTLSIDFIYSSISSLNSNFKLQRWVLDHSKTAFISLQTTGIATTH